MDQPGLRNQAVTAFAQRNWGALHRLAPALLPRYPEDAELHWMTGTACLKQNDLAQAVQYLSRAHELDAGNAHYAAQLAMALSMAQQTHPSLQLARRAVELGPDNADDWDNLGVVFTRCLAYEEACHAFREALKHTPDSAAQNYNLATVLKSLGHAEQAEAALVRCLQLDPCHWPAHYSLAHLGRPQQARRHIRMLEEVLPRAAGNPGAEMPARVALSREYENIGDFANAFEQLTRGKRIGKNALRYDFSRDEAVFDALEARFRQTAPAVRGCESAEPIFVVGMPRSGTTLIERILSSHSRVTQTGELLNFGMAMKRLSGTRTPALLDPAVLAGLQQVDWKTLGKLYIDSTRPSTGQTAHFIDKMPQNFLNLGYIAKALPNAAIICLHRDPMDTCLGNFRELFTLGTPYWDYTFDILDIGRYYLRFRQLMDCWNSVFPGRILEIRYEELVQNQEVVTRSLLDHCALEWEDACLHFEDNPLPVSSASSTQVRAAMHTRGMGRWKNYREQLAGLQTLLEQGGVLPD